MPYPTAWILSQQALVKLSQLIDTVLLALPCYMGTSVGLKIQLTLSS